MHILRNSTKLFFRKNAYASARLHQIALTSSEKNYEEVRIPVPWGHLAGKWWGPKDRRPIFMMHGWQDNCGSFDRLIPFLPDDLGYLAIDYPGHGHSSHMPPGVAYHGSDSAILIRRIQDFFSWDKVSFLSHSMGGIMSFMYTCLFPKDVDILLCIDVLIPTVNLSTPGQLLPTTAANIEKYLEYEKLTTDSRPTFTFEECINRLHEGSTNSVDKETCKYILERGLQLSGDKFYFTVDTRVKIGTLTLSHEELLDHARRVECPQLVLESTIRNYKDFNKLFSKEVIDVLRENKDFVFNIVEGTHHVHLNNPEKVAEIVVPFLNKHAYRNRENGRLKQEIKL